MPDYAAALRQLAADLIQDHAMNVEELEDDGLRDQLEADNVLDQLAGAEQDAALETLKGLLETALVTVTWPEQEPDAGWEPGAWHRIRRPDGTVWMETSSRKEVQAEAEKTGWPLERLYINTRSEWRTEPTT